MNKNEKTNEMVWFGTSMENLNIYIRIDEVIDFVKDLSNFNMEMFHQFAEVGYEKEADDHVIRSIELDKVVFELESRKNKFLGVKQRE